MSILRESYLYHLWAVLCTVYYDSAVHRCLVRMGAWCNRQIDESRVLRVLCREGVAARAWEESILCRLLTGLINLPAWLLHKLYLALRATFDDSVFSRLAFEMGHETAVAQSWLIMLLWVIPFSHWNNAYSMLGFAALLVLFYAGAMSRRDFRLDVRHIGFYPVVLFGAMFLAVLFSYEPSASFRFLLYHISAAMCVLVTVSAVRGTEDLKRLAAGGGVCVLVSSLYGVYQRIQGVEVNESYVDLEVNAGMPGRVESYFDNPNTFAEVLILLLPLVLALILCSKRGISRVTACGVFAVGVLALGMTYSRASWVGMACAMVVLVFLWKPKLIPAFAVLCVVMVPFLPDTIWNRILTIFNAGEDSSVQYRFGIYETTRNLMEDYWARGVGLGTDVMKKVFQTYPTNFDGSYPVHTHNNYLQMWGETGILGLLAYLSLLLYQLKSGVKSFCAALDPRVKRMMAAAIGAFCGILVIGVAEYTWYYPRNMFTYWFLFGVIGACIKLVRMEQDKQAA